MSGNIMYSVTSAHIITWQDTIICQLTVIKYHLISIDTTEIIKSPSEKNPEQIGGQTLTPTSEESRAETSDHLSSGNRI